MMDLTLHISVVIACVVIASILSILFLNSIFTAEKREKIAAAIKQREEAEKAAAKRQKKLQQQQQQAKKDLKREKKRFYREQQKDNTEQEESDVQSEPPSVEDEPQGLSKSHVEFDPDPEVIVGATPEAVRRASIAEREKDALANNSKQKAKKEKKNKSPGILVNKNEPVVIRENSVIDEPANTFETKQPKDTVELKKSEKKDNKKEKNGKKDKNVAFEKPVVAAVEQQPSTVEFVSQVQVAKEVKQHDEKARRGSPKTQASNNASGNNKSKQQSKKQSKETAATKELVLALDKLSDSDTIGVSLLMNLFRRAELNRSEIQLLIDYLLNKQQDTPATHSDWSDDICQKLKRQLEEKEKALAEEQESSIGIQAKLRELRIEINTERTQLNATVKSCAEKLQAKEQEIAALNQELQSINEKFTLERKQFQAKLLLEKQTGSQDLFAQLQRIQSESAHKDKCINELTCLVSACNKANEDLKQQVSLLEQQREELEQISNNRIFELEKIKAFEVENAECKMELHRLQNAHESTKVDLAQARQDLEVLAARNGDFLEKQKQIDALGAKNDELLQQLAGVNMQAAEQSKGQATLDSIKSQLAEKERQLGILHDSHTCLLQQLDTVRAQSQNNAQTHQDLQKLVQSLQQDVANKHQQLQQVEQTVDHLSTREKKLLQQLQEQKEKNDEQQQLFATSQKQSSTTANIATVSSNEEKHVREIFQRLYPEAVKACASTALSASFEQWVEQVLDTQLKLTAPPKSPGNSSNKSTQMSSSSINNATASAHTNNSSHNDNLNNNDNRISTDSSGVGDSSSGSANDVDATDLRLQNTQLRAKVDELTKLVTKTSNTLSALEGHAREEHEKWQTIVLSKDEEISRLQHSNGSSGI
ncbi:ribosome-binding protein 1 isoform X2 [Ceratitis capitata]|uniref:ribosome-binding protein 1 isoform X2 n=1 Tax=Ceratitis capitata TaxID=7213 RepID=UPI0006188F08|nr:ribosome-binding protein 1 isoform X2 [Ceratitis capitata]